MNNSNIVLVPNFQEASSVNLLNESKRAKINTPKKTKLESTYDAFLATANVQKVEEKKVPEVTASEPETPAAEPVIKSDLPDKYDEFSVAHNLRPIVKDFLEVQNHGARKLKVGGVLPPKIEEYGMLKSEKLAVEEPTSSETTVEPDVPVSTPALEKTVNLVADTMSRVKSHEDTYQEQVADVQQNEEKEPEEPKEEPKEEPYSKQVNLTNRELDDYLKNGAMIPQNDSLYEKYGQELDSIMKQKEEYREKIAYLEEVKRNYDDEISKARKQKEKEEAEKAKEYEAKILQETQSLDGIVAQYQELRAAIEAQKAELATYKDE